MKILFLLILAVACGKHDEPSFNDIRDSDGDQIQNYLEGSIDRFVANFETLGLVKGVIKYHTTVPREVAFSNQLDMDEEVLKLAGGDTSIIDEGEYFAEWSMLKLETFPASLGENLSSHTIHLHFSSLSEPDELYLMWKDKRISFGRWSRYMKLTLLQDDFNDLLQGKAKFWLKKKMKTAPIFEKDPEETITQKTYRVFFNDGKGAKILYVANDYSFQQLKEHFGAREATELLDQDIFFNSNIPSEDQWYFRNFKGKDKVLVYTNIWEIRKKFLKRLHHVTIDLRRENGFPVNNIQFQNHPESKIYLKVRPLKIMRNFQEYQETKSYRRGSGKQGTDMSWSCTYYKRRISQEIPVATQLPEFLRMTNISEDNAVIIEQQDERGIFWEIMLENYPPNLTISLPQLAASTYVITNQYDYKCEFGESARDSGPGYQTNPEGKLSYSIESYVEKTR